MVCPCKDCKERFPACHSHCNRYKEWRAKLDKLKEENKIHFVGKTPNSWYQGREVWQKYYYQLLIRLR